MRLAQHSSSRLIRLSCNSTEGFLWFVLYAFMMVLYLPLGFFLVQVIMSYYIDLVWEKLSIEGSRRK